MFEFGTLCLKSENSVQNQTVVSQIDSYVENWTLISKIGHKSPRSDHHYPSNLDILKFRVQIFFEPLKNRIIFSFFSIAGDFP